MSSTYPSSQLVVLIYSLESLSNDDSDSPSSAESTFDSLPGPYDVPKLEAKYYYAGLCRNGSGPKLIYRTSSDVFDIGGAYKRRVNLVTVPGNFDFGPKATWEMIRNKVRRFPFLHLWFILPLD